MRRHEDEEQREEPEAPQRRLPSDVAQAEPTLAWHLEAQVNSED